MVLTVTRRSLGLMSLAAGASLALGRRSFAAVGSSESAPIPGLNMRLVWMDDFSTFSIRDGGPTYAGLKTGSGTWAAPGVWYSEDERGVQGFGMDWFADPSYRGWPKDYAALGQFQVGKDGLRIRSQQAPPSVAALLPDDVNGVRPWLSALINTGHAVRIKPPFYFECRAKMPKGVGQPFPAIWLCSSARAESPSHTGKEYEIDLHEGFGDSNRLHSALHWNTAADTSDYPSQVVVDARAPELSDDFHTWGCSVDDKGVTFYFDQRNVGYADHPDGANWNQPFVIILDVSAGLPWDGTPPSQGPHDMTVAYVKIFAADESGLLLDAGSRKQI